MIHSAATIKFTEKIQFVTCVYEVLRAISLYFRLAVDLNVLGVRRVLAFCKALKDLKCLIHVSTAYAHTNRSAQHVEQLFRVTNRSRPATTSKSACTLPPSSRRSSSALPSLSFKHLSNERSITSEMLNSNLLAQRPARRDGRAYDTAFPWPTSQQLHVHQEYR